MNSKPHAIIIGAGFTGCATAHDLALRGFEVTVLERGEMASGTSGRTHGLLHSGGRYCVNDKESAIECIDENILLRKIAKQCIEFNGGYFLALNDSDLEFAEKFVRGAEECHIPVSEISPKEVLRLEPAITPKLLKAYTAPDGSFDPLRLALAFAATAKHNGARFFPYHEVKKILLNGQSCATGVEVWDRTANQTISMSADMIISATGAWAGQVGEMAGARVPVTPTPGVMVAFDQRVLNHVVNRLNWPGDGDIIIPQRRMAVIGTTSFTADNLDYIPVYVDQVKQMVENAIELVPSIQHTHIRGTYMSARPLVGAGEGRSLARTFKCFDHKETQGIDGFVTITGGKATTCRAMAEKTADIVCQKLGVATPCSTKEVKLVSYREFYS